MENFDGILITLAAALCLHTSYSLVITKYPTETIISYLKHISKYESNETIESFLRMNITEYCHDLRESYAFQSVTILDGRQSEPERDVSTTTHLVPKNWKKIEQYQGVVQMRRFKIENVNQSLNFHSFQCLNHEAQPLWFITSAFIPDSAFLFEVEPRFHYLVTRQINGNNEIPAKLIAIIDEGVDGNVVQPVRLDELYRSVKATNFSGRDKFCDLNRILQSRLCVIAADGIRNLETTFLYHNSLPPSETYRNRLSNFLYQADERDEGCKPIYVKKDYNMNILNSFSHKMLRCVVHISGYNMRPFYSGLVDGFPSKMIYLEQTVINETDWHDMIAIQQIPLLNHLESYQKVLRNIDI